MTAQGAQPSQQTTITAPTAPPIPVRSGPGVAWTEAHPELYENVKRALSALPNHFTSNINIEGIGATDLFSFNSALGTTLEEAVVTSLNQMREVWDPKNAYQTYRFVRHTQSFPDVRLEDTTQSSNTSILMGIELKGWFALAKEGMPSFRYLVTPLACARQDLLVVMPWIFSNVISGTPKLLAPFIEEARYAAEMRNYHWQNKGKVGSPSNALEISTHTSPYPKKSDKCSDVASNDSGGNFGRVARTAIMTPFTSATLETDAAGIPLKYWLQFLKSFTDGAPDERIATALNAIAGEAKKSVGLSAESERTVLLPFLEALLAAASK